MKHHNGMRPQDIVILLKISTLRNKKWLAKDLAIDLKISASEISESLNRSKIAGLLSEDKQILLSRNLLDFLEHGIKYVYPIQPGPIQRGMATATSAPPMNRYIVSHDSYVWPWAKGNQRGQSVHPLHSSIPEVCTKDAQLYELLSLVDTLRLGRMREKNKAIELLHEKISAS